MASFSVRSLMAGNVVIPAHPLALNAMRKLDERRQRGLTRYYIDAGAAGIAIGVHTTQFAIRDPKFALLRPVLELASEELDRAGRQLFRIGGVCGNTQQAISEAALLRELNYDAGLLSMSSLRYANLETMLAHARLVSEVIPIIGFYLQPAVGGCILPYAFWRNFFELPNVVGVKIAPFNRYQTLDVLRALADSGREDVLLLTGNDDNIVIDLLTPFSFNNRQQRFHGGLLGHWAVGTRRAVELAERCRTAEPSAELLQLSAAVTDCNAAYFDAANGFRGCIAGIHEVLRRQGMLEGIWCLDEHECLSPCQSEEIERVMSQYPEQLDTEYIAENRDRWLAG